MSHFIWSIICVSFSSRVETQVFKTKFAGWDDVLGVDFTRTADRVAELRKVCRSENLNKRIFNVAIFMSYSCDDSSKRFEAFLLT